jgi:hypothetical protein
VEGITHQNAIESGEKGGFGLSLRLVSLVKQVGTLCRRETDGAPDANEVVSAN